MSIRVDNQGKIILCCILEQEKCGKLPFWSHKKPSFLKFAAAKKNLSRHCGKVREDNR
mgnify:CR=1 FL=1